MKSLLFIGLLALLMASCKENKPEQIFSDDGVSFTYPGNWIISEQEVFENGVHYMAIEKDGFSSSGIVSLSWSNDSLDLMNWLNLIESSMLEETVYQNSGIKFVGPIVMEYNKNSTISKTFTMSVLTVKHQGVIHIFHVNGKTISVFRQEAIEDIEKNREGFELIEKSFDVQ